MPGPDLSRAVWRISSYSNGSGGSCVEIATLRTSHPSLTDLAPGAPRIAVRDSKNRQGPALIFGAASWHTFVSRVKASQLR
jgi:hypothetical protein